MTEEQKEGAFSNFPISKVTVELLQGKFLGMMWSQEVNDLSCVFTLNMLSELWGGLYLCVCKHRCYTESVLNANFKYIFEHREVCVQFCLVQPLQWNLK